jgi:hypothetical protein
MPARTCINRCDVFGHTDVHKIAIFKWAAYNLDIIGWAFAVKLANLSLAATQNV